MMPRAELQNRIHEVGKNLWIAIENAHSASVLVARWPQEMVMACANMGICARCVGVDRTAFLALLNHTDPTDPGVTTLNMAAADLDAAFHEANNLSRAIEQERQGLYAMRQPGDPITVNQLIARIDALVKTLTEIGSKLVGFQFPVCPCPTSASHPSEVPTQECACHG